MKQSIIRVSHSYLFLFTLVVYSMSITVPRSLHAMIAVMSPIHIGIMDGDDQYWLDDGGVYDIPLNKELYVSQSGIHEYTPVHVNLYYVQDELPHVRTFIGTYTEPDYYNGTFPSVRFAKNGRYEFDVIADAPGEDYDTGAPYATGDVIKVVHFVLVSTSVSVCTQDCNSNVMFLPGIESSRLYRPDYNGGTDTLWEPSGDTDAADLALDATGKSIRNDIYTKDTVDTAYSSFVGPNIYKSFIDSMSDLKQSGKIADWEAVPYDWRLSLDDLLHYGAQVDGRIYYGGNGVLNATDTPYIIQELKRLAASSRTGKVTIVAHSNGGLLAKKLMIALGAEASTYVDKILFVDVPQLGTPATVAALLHGYNQGIPFVLSDSAARSFAQNSPMAYNLLPSEKYFSWVDDPSITIDPVAYPQWAQQYGTVAHSTYRQSAFIDDIQHTRTKPASTNLTTPEIGNAYLMQAAQTLHTELDNWTPPDGVKLIQIAGWGIPTTIKGIKYTFSNHLECPMGTQSCIVKSTPGFEAETTIDGDGTVVTPSQLGMSTSTGVENYWVDLDTYNGKLRRLMRVSPFATTHKDILEVKDVLDFISDSITSTIDLSKYSLFSTDRPVTTSGSRLRYTLHSPLTLDLYDAQGRHTGISTTTGEIEEQIPGTYYMKFGEVQYLFTDTDSPLRVVMNGYATSSFTLNVAQLSGDTVTASTTFRDIPATPQTTATIDTQTDMSTLSPLQLSLDGTHTYTLAPKQNIDTVFDTVPPEFILGFSTSTNALSISATDDSGYASTSITTMYPTKQKKNEEYKGIGTTTLVATDRAGNSTTLVYTQQYPLKGRRIYLSLVSLTYTPIIGTSTTVRLGNSQLQYKWKQTGNSYTMFAAYMQTSATTTEAHYRPKKNQTILLSYPTPLTDDDTDDDVDQKPIKTKLPSIVIPYAVSIQGKIMSKY